jgi:hypothetical protein
MIYTMILIENKEYISYNKVDDNIYRKEKSILESNWDIFNKQDIGIYRLINSNTLIHNIYNEIKRK